MCAGGDDAPHGDHGREPVCFGGQRPLPENLAVLRVLVHHVGEETGELGVLGSHVLKEVVQGVGGEPHQILHQGLPQD